MPLARFVVGIDPQNTGRLLGTGEGTDQLTAGDVDHFGPHVGQHPGGVRAGPNPGQVDHAHTVQRTVHGRPLSFP
jgi:hypothetical protein